MSANEIHLNDVGTILEVTIKDGPDVVDISTATKKELKFKAPSGVSKTKTAAFVTDGSDGKVKYVTISNDLSEVGNWQLQAYIELGDAKLHSNLVTFTVHTNL